MEIACTSPAPSPVRSGESHEALAFLVESIGRDYEYESTDKFLNEPVRMTGPELAQIIRKAPALGFDVRERRLWDGRSYIEISLSGTVHAKFFRRT